LPTNFDNVSIDHNIIDIKKESYEYNFINIIENNDISQAIEIFTKQTEVAYNIKHSNKIEQNRIICYYLIGQLIQKSFPPVFAPFSFGMIFAYIIFKLYEKLEFLSIKKIISFENLKLTFNDFWIELLGNKYYYNTSMLNVRLLEKYSPMFNILINTTYLPATKLELRLKCLL